MKLLDAIELALIVTSEVNAAILANAAMPVGGTIDVDLPPTNILLIRGPNGSRARIAKVTLEREA